MIYASTANVYILHITIKHNVLKFDNKTLTYCFQLLLTTLQPYTTLVSIGHNWYITGTLLVFYGKCIIHIITMKFNTFNYLYIQLNAVANKN